MSTAIESPRASQGVDPSPLSFPTVAAAIFLMNDITAASWNDDFALRASLR
jgi:hypothetical protein